LTVVGFIYDLSKGA